MLQFFKELGHLCQGSLEIIPDTSRVSNRYFGESAVQFWRISSLSDVGESVEFPQAADSKMLLLISDINVEENHS